MGYYDRYSRGGRSRQPQPNEPQSRGVLGTLFNPRFGMSLRPLKETGRMLIQMVALLFAQVDLIDPRHPAVTNVGPRKYNIFEIISLAYQRVEWRQDRFLQCAMFVAVVACLVITGISVTYAAFTLMFNII